MVMPPLPVTARIAAQTSDVPWLSQSRNGNPETLTGHERFRHGDEDSSAPSKAATASFISSHMLFTCGGVFGGGCGINSNEITETEACHVDFTFATEFPTRELTEML